MERIKTAVYIILFILLSYTSVYGQKTGRVSYSPRFANEKLLSDIFDKLKRLETTDSGQVNIVHIGDSHIQAGYITDAIRRTLQGIFGNSGFGFTFPYSLVRTNGPREVKYVSNVAWSSQTNLRPYSGIDVGLSGIALYTSESRFVVQLSVDDDNRFNTVKLFYPTEKPQFRVSITTEPMKITSTVTGNTKMHRIRSGESLSTIAQKYGVTIAQLKKANNMRTDRINAGKSLRIPSKEVVQIANIEPDKNVKFVKLRHHPYFSSYTSDTLLNRVSVYATTGKQERYTMNGFVLENSKPGIIYHSIGVNGARLADYNRYPLFFEQLSALNPDLVIISLGTNESFGRVSVDEYMNDMQRFIVNLLSQKNDVSVLVMTPPPSMFRRNRDNLYIGQYTRRLLSQDRYPVWDMYNKLGGIENINKSLLPLMARDKIHYNQQGYEEQGYLFAFDFLDAFNNYKAQRKE